MWNKLIDKQEILGDYYKRINDLILTSKRNVMRTGNAHMVELYYEIGLTINEFIEKYNLESSQNKIIKAFSNKLTKDIQKKI